MRRKLFNKISIFVIFLSICLFLAGCQGESSEVAASQKSSCSSKPSCEKQTLVFPIPQEMQLLGGKIQLDEQSLIVVPKKPSEQDLFLGRFLTASADLVRGST